jgi:hypothetical protein
LGERDEEGREKSPKNVLRNGHWAVDGESLNDSDNETNN